MVGLMARTKKPTLSPEAKEFFSAAGRRGGKKRFKGVSKEERSKLARKAVAARWEKQKGKKKNG